MYELNLNYRGDWCQMPSQDELIVKGVYCDRKLLLLCLPRYLAINSITVTVITCQAYKFCTVEDIILRKNKTDSLRNNCMYVY